MTDGAGEKKPDRPVALAQPPGDVGAREPFHVAQSHRLAGLGGFAAAFGLCRALRADLEGLRFAAGPTEVLLSPGGGTSESSWHT